MRYLNKQYLFYRLFHFYLGARTCLKVNLNIWRRIIRSPYSPLHTKVFFYDLTANGLVNTWTAPWTKKR